MQEISARPHINGNSSEEFKRAARELNKTCVYTKAKIKQITLEPFHLRNYQHLPKNEANHARERDLQLVEEALLALGNLEQMAIKLLRREQTEEAH